MRKHNYTEEAKLVEVCLNWHRASDERGLTQEERQRGNTEMMKYLLDELMPWHNENYDYSTMDINQ